MVHKTTPDAVLAALFSDPKEPMVQAVFAKMGGSLYTNELKTTALAQCGDFFCFAGTPDASFLSFDPPTHSGGYRLLIPPDSEWETLIKRSLPDAKKRIRYRFLRNQSAFDLKKLQAFAAALPDGFSLVPMDAALFDACRKEEWSADFTAQFASFADFYKTALGILVLHDQKIVSGASTYACYPGGIEIEVDTKNEYRRRGLARAAAAKLILESLKKGFYPDWDAHTEISAKLAVSLGYFLDTPYTVYEQIDPQIAANGERVL